MDFDTLSAPTILTDPDKNARIIDIGVDKLNSIVSNAFDSIVPLDLSGVLKSFTVTPDDTDHKRYQRSLTNIVNTNLDTQSIQYDSHVRHYKLLDYLRDEHVITRLFYNKVKSNDISNTEIIAYEILFNNFKNIKKLKTDISNNINIGRSFLHKLKNYTNTNSNLHLLSKTKNKLQNKIDSYEKHMNIDMKKNKELEKNIENNKKYNYYLIIIYYVILILFFIFSNFIKNKYYKNIIALITIIFYIIAPFVIKYIIYGLYNIWLHILKKFNLLNPDFAYEDIIKYDSYNYENNDENISYV